MLYTLVLNCEHKVPFETDAPHEVHLETSYLHFPHKLEAPCPICGYDQPIGLVDPKLARTATTPMRGVAVDKDGFLEPVPVEQPSSILYPVSYRGKKRT